MKKHIFYTGEIQVGKSTRIREILKQYKDCETVCVFTTTEVNEDGSKTVFLNGREAGQLKNHKVVYSYCDVFDTLGVESLSVKPDTKLVVIDEVGILEEKAEKYSQRVLELLDQTDIPVLGVVQKKACTGLAQAIKNHKNVELIEIDNQ